MKIEQIYNSVALHEEARQRSIGEIRVILSRIYDLIKDMISHGQEFFDESISSSPIDRTAIERTLSELDFYNLKPYNGYVVSSQAIEILISQLEVNDKIIKVLDTAPIGVDIIISGQLNAQLRYILDTSRTALIGIKKWIILDNIQKCHSKNEKINYLNSQIIQLKQNEKWTDKVQNDQLSEFLNLELVKWEKHIEVQESTYFRNELELEAYIREILDREVAHQIELQGGYLNFWRDSTCSEPKKEAEIQQYIQSLFEPHCKMRHIKISREVFAAEGSIDMLFNYLNFKVCMEIKRADHNSIGDSIQYQLPKYMLAEKTGSGIMLVLWYKNENYLYPSKYKSIKGLYEKLVELNPTIGVKIIDCTKPVSPSKINSRSN